MERQIIHRVRSGSPYRKGPSFISSYTGMLIVINVAFWLLVLILSAIYNSGEIFSNVALTPGEILQGKKLWTFLTSMFMHDPSGLGHLFVNMISLIFLGGFLEKLIGKKRFIWLYMASGLFAGLLFVAFSAYTGSDLNISAVGASGAIFGLGGLLAVLTPRLPVLVFFIIPMPMWAAIIALFLILWAISFTFGTPIGNVAHFGGLLVGLAYGFYLKAKYPQKTKMIGRYFS